MENGKWRMGCAQCFGHAVNQELRYFNRREKTEEKRAENAEGFRKALVEDEIDSAICSVKSYLRR